MDLFYSTSLGRFGVDSYIPTLNQAEASYRRNLTSWNTSLIVPYKYPS